MVYKIKWICDISIIYTNTFSGTKQKRKSTSYVSHIKEKHYRQQTSPKLLKIWSKYCNNIVNHVVKFDNMVTILWQYCRIFSQYSAYIVNFGNIVDNIVTTLLFCDNILDHIVISYGESWWCMPRNKHGSTFNIIRYSRPISQDMDQMWGIELKLNLKSFKMVSNNRLLRMDSPEAVHSN